MKIPRLHRWDLTATEARALQVELASKVHVSRPLGEWRTLAAADVSFDRFGTVLYAAVIVFRRGTLEVVQKVGDRRARPPFPMCPASSRSAKSRPCSTPSRNSTSRPT